MDERVFVVGTQDRPGSRRQSLSRGPWREALRIQGSTDTAFAWHRHRNGFPDIVVCGKFVSGRAPENGGCDNHGGCLGEGRTVPSRVPAKYTRRRAHRGGLRFHRASSCDATRDMRSGRARQAERDTRILRLGWGKARCLEVGRLARTCGANTRLRPPAFHTPSVGFARHLPRFAEKGRATA